MPPLLPDWRRQASSELENNYIRCNIYISAQREQGTNWLSADCLHRSNELEVKSSDENSQRPSGEDYELMAWREVMRGESATSTSGFGGGGGVQFLSIDRRQALEFKARGSTRD